MGFSTREEFAVDENGLTADGYRRLAPVSKKSMYVGNLIVIVIVAAVLSVTFVWQDAFGDWAGPAQAVAALLIVVTLVYGLVEPEVVYRRYRYRIDDEKVDLRRGVVFITHSMVPIERIHQVDVSRGPINRAFGLADVQITTAGGTVTIEHLEEDVAEDIAGRLNQSVVMMLRERDRWKTNPLPSGTIRRSWRARPSPRSSSWRCSSG